MAAILRQLVAPHSVRLAPARHPDQTMIGALLRDAVPRLAKFPTGECPRRRAQRYNAGIPSTNNSVSDFTVGTNGTAVAGKLVNYGTIEIEGWEGSRSLSAPTLITGGIVQPTSTSTVTVGSGTPNGSGYFQFADGTLGEAIGLNYFGVITVDGGTTLDGTLSIFLAEGYIPGIGSTYKFLYSAPGDPSGEFASLQNRYFNDGTEMWNPYNNVDGFVELQAVPSPESGSLLLWGSGILGVAGILRRKLMP